MSTRQSVFRSFNLEPGERSTLILLSSSLFLVIGDAAVFGRTVGRALFLSGLPTQYIPFRYIAVTAGVVLASLLYTRIAGRLRPDRLIQWSSLIMIGGLLTFRLLLNTSMSDNLWMLGSFYVFLEIIMALSIVQFWAFASEIVHTRQAKRLFPTVNAAGNLGSILAGAAIIFLVPGLGTPNLIFVMIAMLAVYIILIGMLGRRHTGVLTQAKMPVAAKKKSPGRLRQSLQITRGIPLLATMAGIVVLVTLAVNIVDYQFDLSLKQSFSTNPQGISAFLGSFYFWAGLAGLAVQLIISGPLLRRYGISATLIILPLGILAGSVMVLATGAALWAVTLTRSSDTIFRYTVHDTSFNLLYIPIDRQVRSQARALIDGILKPLTIGMAGVLFFLVNRLLGIVILPWSIAAILVIVLLIVIILRLNPLYLVTLKNSIRRRYFDPANEVINMSDVSIVASIKDMLQQPNENQLLCALALADEIPEIDWSSSISSLVEHESPLVRRQVLRMLSKGKSAEHSELVRSCFDDTDVNVQAAALFTYWVLRGADALDELQPWMHHPVPPVRAAAVSGALLYGGQASEQVAYPEFQAMVTHPQSAVRAAAANALSVLPSTYGRELLPDLLTDVDGQVRLQAVETAGHLHIPEHLPNVLHLLEDYEAGSAAGDALVRFGENILPTLEDFYATTHHAPDALRLIPVVVARIQVPQSVNFLLYHLDVSDDLARARTYLALSRLRQVGVQFSDADLAVIQTRFKVESRLAYQWAVLLANPNLVTHGDLLEDALTWYRRYAVDRLLYLIDILYPQVNIPQVRANLFGNDLHLRANAIELLDTVLSRSHKDLLLPLLEGPNEFILAVGARLFGSISDELVPGFKAIIDGDDPWLTRCALHSISRRGLVELAPLVYKSLDASNYHVREAALLAANRVFPRDEYIPVLQKFAELDYDSNLQDYARRCLLALGGMEEGENKMPISTIERIFLLRGVPLFKEIPPQELELIARLCSEWHFSPGERIINQGELSDSLYILVEGEVQISIDGIGVVGIRRGSDVIGEIGILANVSRTANCTASLETTALRIDQSDFWDLLEHNARLSAGVIRVLVPRLLEITIANLHAGQYSAGN